MTTVITNSQGKPYVASGKVILANKQDITITKNGTYTAQSGYIGFDTVTVNLPAVYANYNYIGSPVMNFNTGVIANFSNTSYLSLPESFLPGNNSWEIVFKVHTANVSTEQYIYTFGTPKSDGTVRGVRFCLANSKLQAVLSYDGVNIGNFFNGTTTILNDTDYTFKLEYTGTVYNMYINGNLEGTLSSSTPIANGDYNYIGIVRASYFTYPWLGTIDLSQSYIKINNQIWWTADCNS